MEVGKARGFAPGPHQRHRLWNPIVWHWEGGDTDLSEVRVVPLPMPNERVLRAAPLAGARGQSPRPSLPTYQCR
jgi:hypothetical protein